MDQKLIAIGLVLIAVIGAGLFFYDYGGNLIPAPDNGIADVFLADDSQSTPEKVRAVTQVNNRFAFDLYRTLSSQPGSENLFFSPYSISTALAMTYEGAKGQTADEMQSVLHFPQDADIRRPGFAKIYNDLNKKDKNYALYTANALWAQKDYPFLDEYLHTASQYYAGKTTNLDFKKENEKSRLTINAWVEDQTNNKIENLIEKGDLPPITRLVLTNAIYFKGKWLKQFDEKNTTEQDFKINNKTTVKVPLMSLTGEEATFSYGETNELQIIELPYQGEELSMLILLPKENEKLAEIENRLNAETVTGFKNTMAKQHVNVFLPKFTFETKYYLKATLSGMGMPTAFSDSADFSGMDGTEILKIGKVIHQAFVEVNEEGTEAAAATAVIMVLKESVVPKTTFRADHPFIFIIWDNNENILFMGKVIDPR
ncbi:MAG: serpin family protein [Candidatus Diapherotrites archaeon]|nr:serpin family protein [Candidatus Diapherotrites archaeon]